VSDAVHPDDADAEPAGGSSVLDWGDIAKGAALAVVIVIPFAYSIRGATSGTASILFLGVLLGFGIGGAVAGRHSTDRYLSHGAIAGALAVVAYLAIAVVDHALTGRAIRVPALVFTALLGACCGMLGANLGDWRRRRAEAGSPPR
jgi:hypothetical protein